MISRKVHIVDSILAKFGTNWMDIVNSKPVFVPAAFGQSVSKVMTHLVVF